MVISVVQQSDSAIREHTSILFQILFSYIDYYRILSRIPCAIQQVSILLFLFNFLCYLNQSTYAQVPSLINWLKCSCSSFTSFDCCTFSGQKKLWTHRAYLLFFLSFLSTIFKNRDPFLNLILRNLFFFFFFFFFFFYLFKVIPTAYRSPQARGSDWSCSCWTTPQPQ